MSDRPGLPLAPVAVPRQSPIVDQDKADSCGLVPRCEAVSNPDLTASPPTIPSHTPPEYQNCDPLARDA